MSVIVRDEVRSQTVEMPMVVRRDIRMQCLRLKPAPIPPLEAGDRLTRHEFERRYDAMLHLKKAELIEGVVYMPSPIRHLPHGKPHALVMAWLGVYYAGTAGVDLSDNATVRLDVENEVQPDALLRLESRAGGRSHISADDYIEGAPELIVEVASTSVSYDLHDKLRVYRRSGVQEYLVWRVGDGAVDWFYLHEGRYVPLEADAEGIVRSRVFPGLWLALPALLNGDLAMVLAVLQKGLQSSEHAGFVESATIGEGL
jgi:Uma2 family endonuclease